MFKFKTFKCTRCGVVDQARCGVFEQLRLDRDTKYCDCGGIMFKTKKVSTCGTVDRQYMCISRTEIVALPTKIDDALALTAKLARNIQIVCKRTEVR